MSNIAQRLVSRGAEPFEFTMTASGTTEEEFILESGTYQSTATYFKNKTLYVTALDIITDVSAHIDYLKIDGTIVVDQTSWRLTAGDDVELSGGSNPTLEDVFASPIPVRIKIALKNSAGGASDDSKLCLRGWMIDQDSEISEK